MAWAAMAGEHPARALGQFGLAGQGDVHRAAHRLPGAGGDRHAGVEAVVAEAAVDAVRDGLAQAPVGPGEGQHVVVAAHGLPFGPGALEEVHETFVVNPQDRLQAELARRHHLAQLHLLRPRQDHVGAAGLLEAGGELAVDQFELAVVQVMVVAVDRQHEGLPGPGIGSVTVGDKSSARKWFR